MHLCNFLVRYVYGTVSVVRIGWDRMGKIESHVLAVTIKWAELVDDSNDVVGRPGQYIGQSQI